MRKRVKKFLSKNKFFREYFNLKEIANVSFINYFKNKFNNMLNIKKDVYWPMHKTSFAYGNIEVGINSFPGVTPGCYIQGLGKIKIGDYCIFAPNVGLISSNHDLYNYSKHNRNKIIIGDYCWVGMNSVLLPGVELGDHVIVAAGSIVTKSFTNGYCVIAGNPAKVIKELDKNKCIRYEHNNKFIGFNKIV